MAVLIASDIAKDMAGEPLLRGVSFKLERRDRLTLSGRNGAGKTTLLRMLSGETSVDGGELSFAKDVRIALHDQRPPRDRDLSLRDYVLSGAKDLLALEERLAELGLAMAGGATDGATLDAYATAQARLEHAGGYTWRESINATLHGLGFRDEHLDRSLSTVQRRRADPCDRSPARWPATPTCCCSTSPPTTSTSSRSNGSRRTCRASTPPVVRSSPTTAGSSRRSAPPCSSWRRAGCGATSRAPGTRGGARRRRASWALGRASREAGGRDRAARALRRPLPGRHPCPPGPVAREEAREDGPRIARSARRQGAGVLVQAAPSAPAAWCSSVEDGRLTIGDRTLLEDFELSARARPSTSR